MSVRLGRKLQPVANWFKRILIRLWILLQSKDQESRPVAFSLNPTEIGKALGLAVLLGLICWIGTTWWCTSKRDHAIRTVPSPFKTALAGTAYEPIFKQQQKLDNTQAANLLRVSLRQMALRSPEGRPLPDDEIEKLAKRVSASLQVEQAEIFTTLPGITTVVRLILNDAITAENRANKTDAERIAEGQLIGQLEHEHAIVRSPEFLRDLVAMKNIPIDFIAKAAAGETADENIRQWPLIHQLALRCLQRLQNDGQLRDARFYVTFFAGWDVFAMWILFWFVLCSLFLRWGRAYIESNTSVLNPKITEVIDTLEQDLRNGNFRNLQTGLSRLQTSTDKNAPIFRSMLDIVKNELEIRQNDSQPDSLLVWTNSLREEIASSRWLLAWCGRALPTVGFIFKVYGIALAMKDSDTIALANAPLDQAAAISNVSGSLGLAFSATFVAFVLSLLVGLAEAWEAHYERSVLASLETNLVRLLIVPPERRR